MSDVGEDYKALKELNAEKRQRNLENAYIKSVESVDTLKDFSKAHNSISNTVVEPHSNIET